jgi:hypothetical protein
MSDNGAIAKQNADVHRDGSTVRSRVMRPEDEAGLRALLTSLSEESRWLRFLLVTEQCRASCRSASRSEPFRLIQPRQECLTCDSLTERYSLCSEVSIGNRPYLLLLTEEL